MIILFIYLAKIYPRGFAGGLREYSDKFHQISCWANHPDNYEQILAEFIHFIEVNIIYKLNIFNISYQYYICFFFFFQKVKDSKDKSEDLPYIYTIETEIGFNMMQAKNSLNTLYRTVYPQKHGKGMLFLEL